MKNGFIRVAAGSPDLKVADCMFNTECIIAMMEKAFRNGVELICFPELSVTGYTCGDLFFQQALLKKAEQCLRQIADATGRMSLMAVVGLPVMAESKLYNCAAVICGGKILGLVPKKNIPNYNEFYERRQFTPAFEGIRQIFFSGEQVPFGMPLLFQHAANREFILAVEICEDLWVTNSPSQRHALAGALLIANPSASDEIVGKSDYRRQLVAMQSAKLMSAYLYADAGSGESTTDLVFAGHDLIAENGTILAESQLFENDLVCADVDVERLLQERSKATTFEPVEAEGYQVIPFHTSPYKWVFTRPISPRPFVPENQADRARRCHEILHIQAAGLAKRIRHTGCKAPVIGISGGLDSTLALLVTVQAMDCLHRDRKEIAAVTMPCFGTTKRTKSNAQILCEQLGVSFQEVNITEAVQVHFRDVGQDPQKLDVTFENCQARERTQVLMDIANRLGGMVIGTGDLSELALGWATYNGDHMSMYGVNASVPKTLVRHLVRYCADTSEDERLSAVLYDILDTPVSPELLPAKNGEISQKTEDIVGPYELHDFFLYYFVRFGFSPEKVFFLASRAFSGVYGEEVIKKWLQNFIRRFFAQQFKRSCIPDGPKVGSVALSPRGDWRMPSDACAALWLETL